MFSRALGPIVGAVLIASLALLPAAPVVGHHNARIDDRIVEPYGVPVSRHIPIVAGYEPFPYPQPCLVGAPTTGAAAYSEDFSGGDDGYLFIDTPLAGATTLQGRNLWSVTTFAGEGQVGTQGERLYFGQAVGPRPGTILVGDTSRHVAGTALGPVITLPEAPSLLTFATKWEVENLAGYDHLFVELQTASGAVHLLCSANAQARVDPSGVNGSSVVASCSPYLFGPCPNRALDHDLGGQEAGPLWETRSVELPASLLGQDVQLRFTFDSSDPAANFHMGWMVDDVRVIG